MSMPLKKMILLLIRSHARKQKRTQRAMAIARHCGI
jgi:hypothetical protein